MDVWNDFYDEEEEAARRKAEEEKKKRNQVKFVETVVHEDKTVRERNEDQWQEVQAKRETRDEVDAFQGYSQVEDARYRADEEWKEQSKTENVERSGTSLENELATESSNKKDVPARKKSKKKSKAKAKWQPVRPDRSRDSGSQHYRDRPGPIAANNRENSQQPERKLHRRPQMRTVNLELGSEHSGMDILEQKFLELEELMTRPLTDVKKKIPAERVEKMVKLRNYYAEMGYTNGEVADVRTGEGEDAYSTIRVLQATAPSVHVQISHDNKHTKQSLHPPTSEKRRSSVETPPPSSSSGRSQSSQEKEKLYYYYSSDEDAGRRSEEESGKPYQPTEMHLKYSDNPKLREWLKRKNVEHRRARKAERTKKREERNEKMVEEELRIARREKSSERVKEWMSVKRKEASVRLKAEQRRNKEAEKQRASSSPEQGLRGTRIDRPRTAPATKTPYRLIKRPNSAARLDEGDNSASKPPDSKFVYKNSVTGHVRLMKLQSERNAEVRNADQHRAKELASKGGDKNSRTSYDDWLLTKKKQDAEKRKAAKQQKDLAKSDPELERIVPEMARQRIERVTNGRKYLDTGRGPRSPSRGDQQQGGRSGHSQQEGTSSDSLAVSGVAASVTEPPAQTRPVSAKARPPSAKKSSSPHRSQSARPASAKGAGAGDTEQAKAASSYKLPFPDELGVPDHVRRVQERIFSKDLTEQSGDSKRPEPQGCDDREPASQHESRDESTLPEQDSKTVQPESEQDAEPAALIAVENALLNAAASATQLSAGTDDTQGAENADPEKEEDTGYTEEGEEEMTIHADQDSQDAEVAADAKEGEHTEQGEEEDKEEQQVEDEDIEDQQTEEEKQQEAEEEEEQEGGEVLDQGEVNAGGVEGEEEAEEEMEPDHVCGEDPVTEAAPEDEEEAEQTEKQADAPDDDQTDTQANKDVEKEEQELDSDAKCGKHVSFSEELTTVFEPGSVELSGNFDDERGVDGPDDSHYMSPDEDNGFDLF